MKKQLLIIICMKFMAKYICIEGTDGVGKTTQVNLLHSRMNNLKIDNIVTNEPGSRLCPLTMQLRSIILDAKWNDLMPDIARDYLFQACRSINLEKVVYPALNEGKHVISDRGALSGICYETAIGLKLETLLDLFHITVDNFCQGLKRTHLNIYDIIIVLEGNPKASLIRASEKKEFIAGDNMEMRGDSFMEKVQQNMKEAIDKKLFKCPMISINVEDKSIQEVNNEIWDTLKKYNIV